MLSCKEQRYELPAPLALLLSSTKLSTDTGTLSIHTLLALQCQTHQAVYSTECLRKESSTHLQSN
jgi:hypothetical protein